jgi:PhoPQ-activated pathogenicity-related protein
VSGVLRLAKSLPGHKKRVRATFFALLFTAHTSSFATTCHTATLHCYLNDPEKIEQPFAPLSKSYDTKNQVTIKTYTLSSQVWPKPDMSQHGSLWQHALTIYQPENVKTDQALLFVNGGTRNPVSFSHNPPPASLNFAKIAALTHSIVIDLQDIPNQQLIFDDNKPRKEDAIVAYSWGKFLDNPASNQFWPVHLAMTKAIIKAMDAAQQIISQESQITLNHFVIAGASKRGWATWLAGLSDPRVNAIVPIVIDVLNTKAVIKHIYESYNHQWPMAFHDYVAEKITDRIDTPQFDQLMQIEDPLHYPKRLHIPKYLISASGDDFFVPDAMNLYLDKLPGETLVRVVPNQPHYISMKVVEEALLSFYKSVVNHTSRPAVTWEVDAEGKITKIHTTQKPVTVRLWEAENPNTRDFRLASGIRYVEKELHGTCVDNHCDYPVTVPPPTKGWKSHFVEVTFGEKAPLVLTTSAYIIK